MNTVDDDGGRSRRFWLHLLDNLFRRWPLFVLPVVLMGVLGASVANGTVALYSSSATLDASENPLLGELDLRGTDTAGKRLTPAQATARFVEEQLRTDVYAASVAEASGLGPALEAGLISTGSIRRNVSAAPNGDSIMVIKATWTDPLTAESLAQAAIDTYRVYIVETVANDSVAAVGFYTELQEQASEEVAAARTTLEEYIDALPLLAEGVARPIEQELTIGRLNNALERADAKVDAAETEIESARLQLAQARSEAGQSVRVIDPPSRPFAPGSRTSTMAGIMLAFGALGLLISGTALVLTTALDRSVRFAADMSAATGSALVATVPELKVLRRRGKRRRRANSRSEVEVEEEVEEDLESESEVEEDLEFESEVEEDLESEIEEDLESESEIEEDLESESEVEEDLESESEIEEDLESESLELRPSRRSNRRSERKRRRNGVTVDPPVKVRTGPADDDAGVAASGVGRDVETRS